METLFVIVFFRSEKGANMDQYMQENKRTFPSKILKNGTFMKNMEICFR